MTLQSEDDCGDAIMLGEMKDISTLVEHSWYDWVWFDMPEDKESTWQIGQWLGPSHDIGQEMCSKIL